MKTGVGLSPVQFLLELIKKYDPESNAYTPDYTLLTPAAAFHLEHVPWTIALTLASDIEKHNLRRMLVNLSESTGQMVYEKAHELANHVINRLEFLLNGSPLLSDVYVDAFPLVILSHQVLGRALHSHLKHGIRETIVEWGDPLYLNEIPPEVRVQALVNLTWLGRIERRLQKYLEHHLESMEKGEANLDDMPFPIASILPNDLGHSHAASEGASMVAIAPPCRGLYELWAVFESGGGVHFHLKPNWHGDDLIHREILMGILLEIEWAILEMKCVIQDRWHDISHKIEHLAKNNEAVTCEWMNALMASDWASRISFDYSSLRNALMTLEWQAPNSEPFGKISKKYRDLYSFSASHEPNKTLLEALAEVEQILAAIRKARTPRKEESAIKHMKKYPHRFKVIRESQVREALEVSMNHSEDARGTNFARDIRESILQKVALQLGLTKSKGWLREFLKHHSDERQL